MTTYNTFGAVQATDYNSFNPGVLLLRDGISSLLLRDGTSHLLLASASRPFPTTPTWTPIEVV